MTKKNKKKLVCDIDNTVSDQLKRFERFFDRQTKKLHPQALLDSEMLQDEPLPGAIQAIQTFSEYYKIIWLSARSMSQWGPTQQWLLKYGFHIDELILVDSHDNKIPFLRELRPDLFIDDLKYDWEILEPKLKTDYIKKLESHNIHFEVFENNWDEILKKYVLHK